MASTSSSAVARASPSGRCRRARRSRASRFARPPFARCARRRGWALPSSPTSAAIEYAFARPAQGVRFDKTVHHFLMQPDGSGASTEHDHEYDRVAWFPIDEAFRVMTHRRTKAHRASAPARSTLIRSTDAERDDDDRAKAKSRVASCIVLREKRLGDAATTTAGAPMRNWRASTRRGRSRRRTTTTSRSIAMS